MGATFVKDLRKSEMDHNSDMDPNAIITEINRLLTECKNYVQSAKNFQVSKPPEGYYLWLDYVPEKINQLSLDWFFLQMLWQSISYSNAARFMENERSFVRQISGVADEILRDLHSCGLRDTNFNLKMSQKVLSLLGDCQRKTDELIETKIREPVKVLAKLAIRQGHPDYKHVWNSFPYPIRIMPWPFNDTGNRVFEKKLVFLYSKLQSICRFFNCITRYTTKDEPIFNDAISVILMLVLHSCSFWFNQKDPDAADVLETETAALLWEINPTNLEFLQSNLEFLESECNNSSGVYYEVQSFCRYLFNWCDRKDVEKELSSLVTLLINNALEGGRGGKEMRNVCEESKAILAEVAFFHHSCLREDQIAWPDRCELSARIRLLKAELFLKDQLSNQFHFLLFSDKCLILDDLKELNKYLRLKENTDSTEELANEIEHLQKSVHSKTITSVLTKHSVLLLLFRILFFKAESVLTELLKSSDTSTAHMKDQINNIGKELAYFKGILNINLESVPSDDETIIAQIEDVTSEVTRLSYSYLPPHKRLEKIIHSLPHLLDKVNSVKANLPEMSQHLRKLIFPNNYELGFLDFLCRNIRGLLERDPQSITIVKHHFPEILFHLESLKSFLMKVKESNVDQGESHGLRNLIMDASYKLEYAVESIENDGRLCQSLWLYGVLEDIRLVDRQVSEIHGMSYAGQVESLLQNSSLVVSRDTTPGINEMLVDLVDEEIVIVGHLKRGSQERDVVSIVGMAGIGKTTLARKVYNNPNVVCHFHHRAWCTASQTYSKRELLLELLSHIDVLTEDINKLTDDELLSKLRRHLLRNRYLIVMDDIWDTEAWNDLEYYFPNNSNGSRILITSRRKDVASIIKPDRAPHLIRPLSDGESWKLLENKIFNGAECPTELVEVGMEIAQQCQGLPLAVVTIAGILQKLESKKDSWIKISKSLSSEIMRNPENRCKDILELSYEHLPEYLKACFTHLGVFLQDKDIPVSKVIRFWMAEGFIPETEWKGFEEVAEDYLMELIDRSLVDIYKTRSNGKVKTLRLHDLLRDLCHLKAKEENFQLLVTKQDEPYASFPDSEYDFEFGNTKKLLAPLIFDSYRLNFYVKRSQFIDSQPSGPVARSLTFFASSDSESKCPYDISFICHNFKLLRVLDLEAIMAFSFPVEIGIMIQLRYLALSGYMQSIPPSISNLWKLETLIVKGSRDKVILPETIWSMVRLRHLHVNNHAAFNLEGLNGAGSSFSMENLVSFSTPSLSCRDNRWRIFKRFPNLRKLKCIFWQPGDDSEECSEFIRWNFLTHLESLKIICSGGTPSSRDFLLPQNLKKLTLSNFSLQKNHLSVIGKLACLTVLKLRFGTFENQKWEMREEEFKELKYLELHTMNLAEWDASCDHLSGLERLVLRNCKYLKSIPSDFANIVTLQKVEVQWCQKSVETSAEEIGDETPEIKVVISRL